MEFFAGEQVVDALIEGVVLAHEHLSLAPDSFARRRILQIVADLGEARLEVLVPRAMISLPQHLGQAGRAVTEVEAPGENNHPGAIRCVRAAALGTLGIDAERDIRAR